jgi:DNA-binding NarL/FixJ family response regulator
MDVKESYGRCTRCGKEGDLGDGLCVKCWDGQEYERQYQKRKQLFPGVADDDLSPREVEIARLIFEGLLNIQIAHKLGISDQTVKNHISGIYRKLHIRTERQLVKALYKRDYISIEDFEK